MNSEITSTFQLMDTHKTNNLNKRLYKKLIIIPEYGRIQDLFRIDSSIPDNHWLVLCRDLLNFLKFSNFCART